MFSLNCNGKLVELNCPKVMGIINVTPNSFYEDSRQQTIYAVLNKVEQMLNEGATFIDIGAQTSKPNSITIGEEEELKRLMPILNATSIKFSNTIISVDTFHAKVAKEAVANGALMINDISAGNIDLKMLETVATLNVPYIAMHMQGTPLTMQQNPQYDNVVQEILEFFIKKNQECVTKGIKDIIIDIGFGFGKTNEHNFELLNQLKLFKMLQKPILIGVSRKSTIYKTLNISPEEALNGTTVLNTVGLMNGANILRVHDVKEAVEAVKLIGFLD